MHLTLLPALQRCSPELSISSQADTQLSDSDGSKSSWGKSGIHENLISNLRGCLVQDSCIHDSFSFSDSIVHNESVEFSLNEAITDEIEFEITKAYEKHDGDTASTKAESRATNESLNSVTNESVCSAELIKQRLSVNYSHHSVRGHHMFLGYPSAGTSASRDFTNDHSQKPCHRVRDCRGEQPPSPTHNDHLISKLSAHAMSNEKEAMLTEIAKTDIEISAMKEDIVLCSKQINYLHESSGPLLSWDVKENSKTPTKKTPVPQLWENMKKLSRRQRESRFFVKTTKAITSALYEKNSSSVTLRKQRGVYFSYEIFSQARTQQQTQIDLAQESFHAQTKKFSRTKKINNLALSGQSSFFINWDNGKWCHHGEMPLNLQNRLKDQSHSFSISYLAVGPNISKNDPSKGRYYYSELANSEGWWVNFDPDFHKAVQKLPVHRVAFGNPYPGSQGMPSWVVLGKDGRAAWKGIPSHLHIVLSSRDSSLCSACEVSLGPAGSYFVKFLSGEIDYCLPAAMANRCEEIENLGGVITNILLHVDCSGFIIRHTALGKKQSTTLKE